MLGRSQGEGSSPPGPPFGCALMADTGLGTEYLQGRWGLGTEYRTMIRVQLTLDRRRQRLPAKCQVWLRVMDCEQIEGGIPEQIDGRVTTHNLKPVRRHVWRWRSERERDYSLFFSFVRLRAAPEAGLSGFRDNETGDARAYVHHPTSDFC